MGSITNYQLRITNWGRRFGLPATPKSPLPAGEGWVRESRTAPSNAIGKPPTLPPPPSFRRRPESRTPAVVGAGRRIAAVHPELVAGRTAAAWLVADAEVGSAVRLSLTQPSPAGRRLFMACAHTWTSAVIPAPHRHSRESGKPHPGLLPRPLIPGFWIPSGAGMRAARPPLAFHSA